MMTVYVLTYAVGMYSGHKELIGIYDTPEKATKAKEKDMRERGRFEWNFTTTPIQINKTINEVYMEW